MHHYSVFGGVLRSNVALPDLAAATASRPDWDLVGHEGATPPARDAGRLIAHELIDALEVRVTRHADGIRVLFGVYGTYDISAGGARIDYYPAPGAALGNPTAALESRLLPLALAEQGVLALHASAVAYEDGAVVFCAPKGTGKSTLATALVLAGARLLSDDLAAVRIAPVPEVLPGVEHVKLWSDAMQDLVGAGADLQRGKYLWQSIPEAQIQREPTVLRAIYILTRAAEAAPALVRTRLAGPAAANAVAANAKLATLLRGTGQLDLVDQSIRLASAVPVYRLEVARSLPRIREVAAELERLHGAPRASTVER